MARTPSSSVTDGPPAAAAATACRHPLPFRLLPQRPTSWDPSDASVTLNVRLGACICPSEASAEGARISYSHAVVIDDFVDDATRAELLHFLLHGAAPTSNDHASPPCGSEQPSHAVEGQSQPYTGGGQLPKGRWERRTTDMAGAAPTWGVRQHVLQELAAGHLPAMQEVHARLARLYPECDIAHLPSDAIQLPCLDQPAPAQQADQGEQPAAAGPAAGRDGAAAPTLHHPQQEQAAARSEQTADQQQLRCGQAAAEPGDARAERAQQPGAAQQAQQAQQHRQHANGEAGHPPAKRSRVGAPPAPGADSAGPREGGGGGGATEPSVDCACFVANAAVAGDTFRYHVDADPTSFPDGSPWHVAYGDYFNGEPGKPLLVSLLLYLNEEWEREWGADTLFLDDQTDTGIFVVPRPCRAVLLDQDIMHRVSPPSAAAGGRPRFSLVWKLAFLPRQPGQALCLARPEWGPPTSFGSAARIDAVKRQLAAERRQRQGQPGGSQRAA